MISFLSQLESGAGLAVILWFQSWRTDHVTVFFQPFNRAGEETFFLIALTIIYWTINKAVGRRLTVIFLASAWLNAFCKSWWQRPRPFQVSSDVKPPYTVTGYGLPSGHTQTATTVGAVLMAETRKRWALILLFLYMFLMGISRMVHGVHFPQDVVLGWILGIAVVLILLGLENRFRSEISGITASGVAICSMVVIFVMIGLGFAVESEPHRMAGIVTPAAVLAGVIPGFYLESKYLRFSTGGRLTQRWWRYLTGIIAALLIKEGLKPLLEIINDQSLFMTVFVRFIRYFLLGLWISAGAPWLFTRTRLAARENP